MLLTVIKYEILNQRVQYSQLELQSDLTIITRARKIPIEWKLEKLICRLALFESVDTRPQMLFCYQAAFIDSDTCQLSKSNNSHVQLFNAGY